MKYAIFSDIHSNLEALAAVLKDARDERVDRFICLGDIVGIGASPIECIEILQSLEATIVRGEHDLVIVGEESKSRFSEVMMKTMLWTRKQLNDSQITWLRNLPSEEKLEHFRLTHANLNQISPWQKINTAMDASDHFDFQRESLCFVGHSHLQKIFQLDAISEELKCSEMEPKPMVKTVVTVGAVGRPQDHDPNAAYIIYDSDKNRIIPRRVPYDVRSAQLKMKAAGFNIDLIKSLALGK